MERMRLNGWIILYWVGYHVILGELSSYMGGLSCYTGWVIILNGWVIILTGWVIILNGWLSSYTGWVIILNAVDNLILAGWVIILNGWLSSYTGWVIILNAVDNPILAGWVIMLYWVGYHTNGSNDLRNFRMGTHRATLGTRLSQERKLGFNPPQFSSIFFLRRVWYPG